jgi:ABC-2 type transport system permease protein
MKKIKTVLPITMGIVFGFFVLQLLNQSLDDVKIAFLTPFAYFDATSIIKTGGLKSGFLAIDFALIFIFVALTYVVYNKKDVPSV